ncbi:Lipopolysaccharide-responsive and beige-like anchor protein [Triplophysa tibetana]|uniref:Lipopolysaccharide-responsive and beige-like anchor protein n=1 Tax=Triplophysa tibetana TaxID=1572043 RepID=A0A5A9PNL7_9TELE|nr:Lipopolysaccharide-responsive and beige-like anchor protein [Triplophysa tibetana]
MLGWKRGYVGWQGTLALRSAGVSAMFLSKDGQYLLSGGDGGVLTVWQIHDLKKLFTYPGCDAGIRSMAMSHDQRCIISGMASGSIVLFYNDFNRWHHEYQTRY